MTVLHVEYKASQHWSFPTSNLMIGCHAIVSGMGNYSINISSFIKCFELGNETLDVDTTELEDARWFSLDEVRSALALIKHRPMETMAAVKDGNGHFFVPPRGTLAYALIDSWFKGL